MSDAISALPDDFREFLSGSVARNRALYGDLRMEATEDGAKDGDEKGSDGSEQPKEDGSKDGDKGETPKPTDTVEYWKKRSRENERRAKENAEDAKKYAELQDAQKTEEQKRRELEERTKQETEALRLDNLRLRAAGTHGVSGEDEEGIPYADLIHGTDDESVKRSAEAIGRLVSAVAERDALQQELDALQKGRRPAGRPSGGYRSGAVPPGEPTTPSGSSGAAEAERRFGSKTNA